jgi:hypothetical protein
MKHQQSFEDGIMPQNSARRIAVIRRGVVTRKCLGIKLDRKSQEPRQQPPNGVCYQAVIFASGTARSGCAV